MNAIVALIDTATSEYIPPSKAPHNTPAKILRGKVGKSNIDMIT
jgi:hypothetical protein